MVDFTGRIVAAAVKYGDLIATVPAPGRHHNIIWEWSNQTGLITRGQDEQGFITSNGIFVDRKTALRIANAFGQVREKHGNPDELYSEDMW